VNLIKRFVRTSALVAVVLAVISTAQAQQPAQPPTQQPAQPPTQQPAQPPVQPKTAPTMPQVNSMQGGIAQSPWFSNPQVRQQLKLSDEQFNNLNKAYGQAYTTYQQGVNGMDKTLTDALRQQRMNELQQSFYRDLGTASTKYLTDPTQQQRYNQLYWQYQGYGAFTNPTIAEMLKLTPEQRERFGKLQQDWSTQMGKLSPLYQTDKQQALDQFSKLQGQSPDMINAILTPEQQATWRQLAGMPFVFPPDIYFNSTQSQPKSGGE